MVTSWDFEYRIWRTSRDEAGCEDADLFVSADLGVARGYWRESQSGRWMPPRHERGNVSAVMIFRKPAHNVHDGPPGHGLGWSPYGALDGTSDVRCGRWPVPDEVFERSAVLEAAR